ncbi:thermonuclease family protein [Streptomyces sp. NPDC002082]|uniref:thermonuclease family protein n=1 Tax=Streptomyces sp. NPDC002082 TaxID=3154772 RepID=UPI003333AC88
MTIGELAGDGDGQVSTPPTPIPVQPKGRPQEPGIGPSPAEPSKSVAQHPTVVGVIDGDTIDVRGAGGILPAGVTSRVRLLTIDAPEKGACYSRDATARTKALLPKGSGVRIERDTKLKDPYGRYLLYVWNEQGVFVNDSLVRSGHAKGVLYPPNDAHWPKISQANETARKAGAGLWSACPGPAPKPAETPKPADADNPAGLPPGPPAGIQDVDCSDLSGAVWVGAADPHRLDRDGDGIGCDSK